MAARNRHSGNEIIGYFTLQEVQKHSGFQGYEIQWLSNILSILRHVIIFKFCYSLLGNRGHIFCVSCLRVREKTTGLVTYSWRNGWCTRTELSWLAQTSHLRRNKCWIVNTATTEWSLFVLKETICKTLSSWFGTEEESSSFYQWATNPDLECLPHISDL